MCRWIHVDCSQTTLIGHSDLFIFVLVQGESIKPQVLDNYTDIEAKPYMISFRAIKIESVHPLIRFSNFLFR